MDFMKYIHAVGTGIKGNRDLSFEESIDMMEQILQQKVHPEQISAFLLGWRLKPETVNEFRGALIACDNHLIRHKIENSIELGYPFDGKVKNPYIFPLVAEHLQKTSLQLIIPGDDGMPPKNGITTKDIFSHMTLSENCHFFDRQDYCHALHKLIPIRSRLGLRTGLSTIEKLPGVAQSEFALTGVFHKPYVQKYIDIFGDRYKRFALLQGNEGTPELFSKGRLWIAENNNVQEHTIDPKFYGIDYEKSWEKITMQESRDQLLNPSDEFVKLARLNAAIYLFVANEAKSVDDAFEMLNG